MDPPWQVKKALIATLDSIAMLSAGAFPSQPHWCRRPSPHECPPPGFPWKRFVHVDVYPLAHGKPLSIRQPAARQTYESRVRFPSFFLSPPFFPRPLVAFPVRRNERARYYSETG